MTSLQKSGRSEFMNFYSGTFLDRSSELRNDLKYLTQAVCNENTLFIVFHKCCPLVEECEENEEGGKKLSRFSYHQIHKHFDVKLKEKGEKWPPYLLYLGRCEFDWFAVNELDGGEEFLKYFVNEKRSFAKGYVQGSQICWRDSGVVSLAQSMFQWHDRYRFCSTCGSKMFVEEAGYKKTCVNETCRSRKGIHNVSYPRTDPTVIMMVLSKDGKKCLLGRKASWPPKMYSCLAGFMEPGESIEDTVKRETKEESGVKVDLVKYISSQPWPFPCSLMIGCQATALTEEITVNKEEMDDVKWFGFKMVDEALEGLCEDLILPPEPTIAHQLIKYSAHQKLVMKNSSL